MDTTPKCKRGCHWPTYWKTDRYGDAELYCQGCHKPVEQCDCRREREREREKVKATA